MSEHFQNQTEKSEKSEPLTHKGMPDKFRSNTDTSIKRGWIELDLCLGLVVCVCLHVALSGTYCVAYVTSFYGLSIFDFPFVIL